MPSLIELFEERTKRNKEFLTKWEELKSQQQEEARKDQQYFDQQVAPFKEDFVTSGLSKDLEDFANLLLTKNVCPSVGEVICVGLDQKPENAHLCYVVYLSMIRPNQLDRYRSVFPAMERKEIRENNRPIVGYGVRVDWGNQSIDVLSIIDSQTCQNAFIINQYQIEEDKNRTTNKPLRSFKSTDPDEIRQKILDFIFD